eukprot:2871656-Pleurochrysis_carterae.AAC.1
MPHTSSLRLNGTHNSLTYALTHSRSHSLAHKLTLERALALPAAGTRASSTASRVSAGTRVGRAASPIRGSFGRINRWHHPHARRLHRSQLSPGKSFESECDYSSDWSYRCTKWYSVAAVHYDLRVVLILSLRHWSSIFMSQESSVPSLTYMDGCCCDMRAF